MLKSRAEKKKTVFVFTHMYTCGGQIKPQLVTNTSLLIYFCRFNFLSSQSTHFPCTSCYPFLCVHLLQTHFSMCVKIEKTIHGYVSRLIATILPSVVISCATASEYMPPGLYRLVEHRADSPMSSTLHVSHKDLSF